MQPTAPTPQTENTNPTPPPAPMADILEPPQKKDNSKLIKIIAIVVGSLVVLALAVFVYFYMIGMQVINASNDFMKSMASGDVEKALTYVNTKTESDREFVRKSAASVKGESKGLAHASQDGKVYFVYTLTHPTNKYARTTLQKLDGKWKVIAFVYSPNALTTIPASNSTGSATPTQNSASGTQSCLVARDFDNLFMAVNGTARPASLDYSSSANMYLQNVHFNVDSLTFTEPQSLANETIAAFASFAKQNSAKTFTIHLRGSVGTTKASDLEFANQRAAKVKALLVAKGVKSSQIVIDTPSSAGVYDGANSNESQSARNVTLTINPACSTNITPSSSGL